MGNFVDCCLQYFVLSCVINYISYARLHVDRHPMRCVFEGTSRPCYVLRNRTPDKTLAMNSDSLALMYPYSHSRRADDERFPKGPLASPGPGHRTFSKRPGVVLCRKF